MKHLITLLLIVFSLTVKGQVNVLDYFLHDVETKEYYSSKENCISVRLGSEGMNYLPSDITEYKNVERIELSNNPNLNFDSIGIILSYLPKLKVLDLSSNELTNIPKSLFLLKKLEVLILKNNKIIDLPNFLIQMNIKDLDLSYNKGIKLENLPMNLKNLSISNIGLDSISREITDLQYLEYLSVSQNNIKVLPCSLSNLVRLKYFYCLYNPIEYYPKCLLDMNALKIIPREYFR